MNDLTTKIILAVIAFLLGLLADVIKKAFGRERRRVTYSIRKEPIISVSQSLPAEVLEKLPTAQTLNVVFYRVLGENTGTQAIKGVNLLATAAGDAELIHHEIITTPAREVPLPESESSTPNEIRFKGICLERKQSIAVNLFFRSRTDARLQVYWSGGENVDWSLSSATEEFGLEEHLVAIIRNYILAEFLPAFLFGIFYLLSTIVIASPTIQSKVSNIVLSGSAGVGQLLSSLLRFYFYLRIIPHVVAVIRDLRQRRPSAV